MERDVNIHAVGGDIVALAPHLAEVSALWLRKGYCQRDVTWKRIRHRYRPGGPLEIHLQSVNLLQEPWLSTTDQSVQLVPPDNRLKLLCVFSNPNDALMVASLNEIRALVRQCLDEVDRQNCRSVAMIHIPAAVNGHKNDVASAEAMIEAIRTWDDEHPGLIGDVFLVDRENGFSQQLQGMPVEP
jgi:hypothetical protein